MDGIVTSEGQKRFDALPASQQKFAWGADRIAHELTTKMEQAAPRIHLCVSTAALVGCA